MLLTRMAMDPEERPRHSADVATLDEGGPAPFGGGQQQQQQHQQQQQLRLEWASGRMPRSLRLQAVCGAVSCVDESPTAAASPGVSLLRSDITFFRLHLGCLAGVFRRLLLTVCHLKLLRTTPQHCYHLCSGTPTGMTRGVARTPAMRRPPHTARQTAPVETSAARSVGSPAGCVRTMYTNWQWRNSV